MAWSQASLPRRAKSGHEIVAVDQFPGGVSDAAFDLAAEAADDVGVLKLPEEGHLRHEVGAGVLGHAERDGKHLEDDLLALLKKNGSPCGRCCACPPQSLFERKRPNPRLIHGAPGLIAPLAKRSVRPVHRPILTGRRRKAKALHAS